MINEDGDRAPLEDFEQQPEGTVIHAAALMPHSLTGNARQVGSAAATIPSFIPENDIQEIPHDKKGRVRISFGLIGVATLLPWNIFITATDYWMFKFRDVNDTHQDHPRVNKTELQTFFTSYLSISSNVPFLLMLIVNAFIGHKLAEHARTLIGLIAITVIFIFTTLFVEVDTDQFQDIFFRMTLLSVVLMSCFSAIFQGSIVSVASIFPSRNMHFYATGQSIAGIYAVFAQVLALSGYMSPTTTALYYFISADVLLITTLVAYLWLVKSEYYCHFLEERARLLETQLNESTGSTASINGLRGSLLSGWNTFKAVKWHALTVLQVYWMTIAVFPPLTVLVVPHHPNKSIWSGRFFIPITNFFMFCVADFVGRFVSKNLKLSVRRPKLLFFLSCSRWLLVPLVMMCNAHPRSHLPVWFTNDFVFIFLVTLIGFSNGYLYIVAMINGPEYVSTDLRAKTGFVLVLFLGFGVAFGSITSNFILRLL